MAYEKRTPMQDVQDRMGISSIEELLAERDILVREVAYLRSRHGPGGVYTDLRKIKLALIAAKIRAEVLRDGKKITDGTVDDLAHADPAYIAFVAQATDEKADWAIKENQIDGITETINRGQVVGRFLAMELGLSK